METPSIFTVPEAISFEQAIKLTQALLAEMEHDRLSEDALESIISALVKTENGARGFFVSYSSDDRAIADHPSPAVIRALRSSPKVVSELLVKNLAMSTAMILTHTWNQNPEMAKGSEQVQRRTENLIRLVQMIDVNDRIHELQETIQHGEGKYQSFLERWHYNSEQRQAIQQLLQRVIT